MRPGLRIATLAATGLVLLPVAGAGIWFVLRSGSPAALPPPVEAPPPPMSEVRKELGSKVLVKSVRGEVETQRAGGWVPATAGSTLNEQDAIRTGPGGEAVLAVGSDDSRVVVKERSAVSVREVKSEVARVRLERGRIGADLKGKLLLQVESEGSDTVAEAKQGRFSVFNNGKGLVAVAAETAEVKLKTPRGSERVAVGKQVIIKDERASKANDIPQAVFLNVNWPAKTATRAKSIPVTGRAAAGTEVMVNGRIAVVAADGTFTVEIPLNEGDNAIEVQATDVLGRKKKSRKKVTAFHTAPEVDADGEGMWK